MKVKVEATGQIIYLDHEDCVYNILKSVPSDGMTPLFLREYPESESFAVSQFPITIPEMKMFKFLETGRSTLLTRIEE